VQTLRVTKEAFPLLTSTSNLGIAGVASSGFLPRAVHNYAIVNYYANQNSASGGVKVEQSMDGTNVHKTTSYTYTAGGDALVEAVELTMPFVRVRIVNGGSATTTTFINAFFTEADSQTQLAEALESVSATVAPNRSTTTDASGSITAGGTSQQILAANTSRTFLFIQNHSTEILWVRFGAAANTDQPSYAIPPNEGTLTMRPLEFIDTRTVNIIGATTGSKFTAKEA
jgi:hypothetical protein